MRISLSLLIISLLLVLLGATFLLVLELSATMRLEMHASVPSFFAFMINRWRRHASPALFHACPSAPECETRETLQALWPEAHLDGYSQSVCCEQHTILRELMLESIAFFERHNLTYYVSSGSLLGLMRHEYGVIPWEKDGDLDIVWPHFPRTFSEHRARQALLMRFNNESQIAELTPCQDFHGLCKIAYKVRHKIHTNVTIHVDWFQVHPPHPELTRFVANKSTLLLMNPNWNFFRYRRDWLLPTVKCTQKLYGREVMCPSQPGAWLAYLYGKLWRIGRTGRGSLTTKESEANHDYWNIYFKRPPGWHQKPNGMQEFGDEWQDAHKIPIWWAMCSLNPSEWCGDPLAKKICLKVRDVKLEC